ncbi:hypothetical protein SLS58_007365 [Diplodia intermedia]|uniref:Interferon-induced 6-16 family n=1 Tax=Diplodia intermedia TaxID=856260 RepID=A0ABR3TK66_9PEZI
MASFVFAAATRRKAIAASALVVAVVLVPPVIAVIKIKQAATNACISVKNKLESFRSNAPPIIKKELIRIKHAISTRFSLIIAWVKEHPYLTALIVIAIILAIVLPPVILHAAGFTAAGVAAGSLAAASQSSIGGAVAAGSTFATLTSAGMGGYGLPCFIGAVVAVYATGALGASAWYRFSED